MHKLTITSKSMAHVSSDPFAYSIKSVNDIYTPESLSEKLNVAEDLLLDSIKGCFSITINSVFYTIERLFI